MSDYKDLIFGLRQLNLKTADMTAEVIEAQAKRIAELSVPLCIGETTIRILAKEGACDWIDGRALVAADELFKQDPYARIAELEAALKPLADSAIYVDEIDYDLPIKVKAIYLRNARKALEKNDE